MARQRGLRVGMSLRSCAAALFCAVALLAVGVNFRARTRPADVCAVQLAEARQTSEQLSREVALVRDLLAQLRSVKADLSHHRQTSLRQLAAAKVQARADVAECEGKLQQAEQACSTRVDAAQQSAKIECKSSIAAAVAAVHCATATKAEAEQSAAAQDHAATGEGQPLAAEIHTQSHQVATQGDTNLDRWGQQSCQSWLSNNRKGCSLHDSYRKNCAKECQEPYYRDFEPKPPQDGLATNLPDWFIKNPMQDMRCGEAIPFVNLKHRLVVCTSPKSASTSWRDMLIELHKDGAAQHEKYQTLDFCPQKILRLTDLYRVDGTQAQRIMADQSYFKLAFVRNPITRILSAYLMWAQHEKSLNKFLADEGILGSPNQCPGLNKDWSDLAQHWYPQHCRCGFQEGVKWDFIGKMEDLPETFREIRRRHAIPDSQLHLEKWGLTDDLERIDTARKKFGHETSASKKLCRFSLALFDALAAARSDEIDFFGYTEDVKKLRMQVERCPNNTPAGVAAASNSHEPGAPSPVAAAEQPAASSATDKKVLAFIARDKGYAIREAVIPNEAIEAKWPVSAGAVHGSCPLPASSPLHPFCPDQAIDSTPAQHRHVLEVGLSGHNGIGFWSQVTYVLNQLILARRVGFVPYVWLGQYSMKSNDEASKTENEYYANDAGPNVWSYFFLPVSDFRPTAASQFACCYAVTSDGQHCLHQGCINGEESVLSYYYGHGKSAPVRRNTGDRDYDHEWYGKQRMRASEVVRSIVRFTPGAAQKLEQWRNKLFGGDVPVLGVHIRGTDKSWGGGTITASQYRPFILRYLRKHPNAQIFVATDDPKSLKLMKSDPDFGYRVKNFDAGEMRTQNWAVLRNVLGKAEAVFMDGMLLAMCDYLLLTASAVAESAIYFNPKLHNNSLNLQYKCGHMSWLIGQDDGCMSDAETPPASWGAPFEGCSSFQIAALQATGKVHRYSCVYADPPVAFSAQTSVERVAQDAKKHALKLHPPDKYHVYDD